jgi:hypothetical protein
MPIESMSRRAFLAAGGGALLLAACSGSSSDSGAETTKNGFNAKGLSAFRMEIEPYASDAPQRFAFILTRNDGSLAGGPAAALSIAAPSGSFGPAMPATYHAEGLPQHRGVYVVDLVARAPGNWRGAVKLDGQPDAELAFPVSANPDTPIIGEMAPVVSSPTVTSTMGVDPLCTRTDAGNKPAPCAFHQTSLDQVIGKGKPVIAMFATPARCQSRYCGPVLEQLIAVAPGYGDAIIPIHVEIYKDLTSYDLVLATETWLGITGEPWIFAIDGTGKVTGRLSGAFATDEIRALIDHTLA